MADPPAEAPVLEEEATPLAAGTNQFVPWVPSLQTNMTAIAAYMGDARTTNGVVAGVADPLIYNRAVHQAAFIAAGLAQFVANSGVNVMDDGSMSLATFVTNLSTAIAGGLGQITNAKLAPMAAGTVKAALVAGPPVDEPFAGLLAAMGVVIPTFAHFQNQANPEALTANGWSIRTLNWANPANNIPGVALSGNQISGLPQGTYVVRASASAYATAVANLIEMKLRILTGGGATVISGQNTYSGASTSVPDGGNATLQGLFKVPAGGEAIELDSWQNANLTSGGVAMGTGETDIYADVLLTKVA
jgi:hypothetical protein